MPAPTPIPADLEGAGPATAAAQEGTGPATAASDPERRIPATRLVIVEGLMGSGKSTLSRVLAHQLEANGVPSRLFPETWTRPNPTDVAREVMSSLPRRGDVWDAVTPAELVRRSDDKWRSFVAAARTEPPVNVFDGQLFNGDHTVLMLMDEPAERLSERLERIVRLASPLRPVLIYLYQEDMEEALRRTASVRGRRWLRTQIGWRLESPYCRRLGLEGTEGWMALYRRYRELTDRMAFALPVPTLRLETSDRDWRRYEREMAAFLGIEPRLAPGFRLSQWLRAKYDDLFAHR